MARKLGNYAFMAGVLIAIVVGMAGAALGPSKIWFTSLLVILGILVGFLNVSGKEAKDFLFMAAILIVASFAGNAGEILTGVQLIGGYLQGIFGAMLSFVVPATIVAALRAIWLLGYD